jgi:2-oxoglutarate ferredoxin oxidoreductase subunit alpha
MAGLDTALGMVVIQSESEIAAMNMVVGAGYTGVRAMTATSGGGFCLMTEAFGLAGMTETPVVVMLGQRPGPSTGMATYSAQSDLLFAINTSQGEFPRIVIAPADVDDCFYRTIEAFNLAEKYQVPVIIITDKFLVESHKSTKKFDVDKVKIERGDLIEKYTWVSEESYFRYKITESGISPRIILGTENSTMLANGNEHDEYGFTTIDPIGVVAMAEKRYRKLKSMKRDIINSEPIKIFGEENSEVTIVGWGSTKGPALEAVRILKDKGIKSRFAQVVFMEPFPTIKLKDILNSNDVHILFETNVTGQLDKLIKLHTGFSFEHKVLKYNGRPFTPEEICARVEDVLG